MKTLIDILRNTEQTPQKYIVKAALISIIPSVLMAAAAVLIFKPSQAPLVDTSPMFLFFGAVLMAPWLQTLLMIPIFWILKRFSRETLKIAIFSAVIWALLHSSASPIWGLTIIWPFFVFSFSFLNYEKKSTWEAIQITASIHMCQNLFATLLILLAR